MAVRIRSLAVSGPLHVPLMTGGTERLEPGEVSRQLSDVEVARNARVDKLRERRLIAVEPVPDDAAEHDAEEHDEGGTAGSASESGSDTSGATAPRRTGRSG